jgi:TRAP-type C4-dicarboxylate transport system substrate-binding protein
VDALSEGGILYEEEYAEKGLRPLWISIIPNYEILTADQKVLQPSDLKGLVLRSSGGAFDVTLGNTQASAASMPASDTYEAMSHSLVDGTAMPFISVAPYRLDEVAKYSTDGLNLGSVGIPYVISEQAWDALAPHEQDVIAEAGRRANQSLCSGLNEQYDDARQYLADNGVELTKVDASQGAWRDTLKPVQERWARSLDAEGLPGSEVLRAYKAAITRHEGGHDA